MLSLSIVCTAIARLEPLHPGNTSEEAFDRAKATRSVGGVFLGMVDKSDVMSRWKQCNMSRWGCHWCPVEPDAFGWENA